MEDAMRGTRSAGRNAERADDQATFENDFDVAASGGANVAEIVDEELQVTEV
jgi:hypothetical protein